MTEASDPRDPFYWDNSRTILEVCDLSFYGAHGVDLATLESRLREFDIDGKTFLDLEDKPLREDFGLTEYKQRNRVKYHIHLLRQKSPAWKLSIASVAHFSSPASGNSPVLSPEGPAFPAIADGRLINQTTYTTYEAPNQITQQEQALDIPATNRASAEFLTADVTDLRKTLDIYKKSEVMTVGSNNSEFSLSTNSVKNGSGAQALQQNDAVEANVDVIILRCICGSTSDLEDGRKIVCCDKCDNWQHLECMGLPLNDEELNDTYYCEVCKPNNHRELLVMVDKAGKHWGKDAPKYHDDDIVIRCTCGATESEVAGRKLVCCDECNNWQHIECMGIPHDDDTLGKQYFCDVCKPENHAALLEKAKEIGNPCGNEVFTEDIVDLKKSYRDVNGKKRLAPTLIAPVINASNPATDPALPTSAVFDDLDDYVNFAKLPLWKQRKALRDAINAAYKANKSPASSVNTSEDGNTPEPSADLKAAPREATQLKEDLMPLGGLNLSEKEITISGNSTSAKSQPVISEVNQSLKDQIMSPPVVPKGTEDYGPLFGIGNIVSTETGETGETSQSTSNANNATLTLRVSAPLDGSGAVVRQGDGRKRLQPSFLRQVSVESESTVASPLEKDGIFFERAVRNENGLKRLRPTFIRRLSEPGSSESDPSESEDESVGDFPEYKAEDYVRAPDELITETTATRPTIGSDATLESEAESGLEYDDYLDYIKNKYDAQESNNDLELPVFGESGSENGYGSSVFDEIEQEAEEKRKREEKEKERFLSIEQVDKAIDEGIENIKAEWRSGKAIRLELDANRIWRKSRRDNSKRSQIVEALSRIEEIQNNRLPKMRKEILDMPWTRSKRVRHQTKVMERSLVEIEELRWKIVTLKQRREPTPPPTPMRKKSRDVSAFSENKAKGDLIVNTDKDVASEDDYSSVCDNDLAGFIIGDDEGSQGDVDTDIEDNEDMSILAEDDDSEPDEYREKKKKELSKGIKEKAVSDTASKLSTLPRTTPELPEGFNPPTSKLRQVIIIADSDEDNPVVGRSPWNAIDLTQRSSPMVMTHSAKETATARLHLGITIGSNPVASDSQAENSGEQAVAGWNDDPSSAEYENPFKPKNYDHEVMRQTKRQKLEMSDLEEDDMMNTSGDDVIMDTDEKGQERIEILARCVNGLHLSRIRDLEGFFRSKKQEVPTLVKKAVRAIGKAKEVDRVEYFANNGSRLRVGKQILIITAKLYVAWAQSVFLTDLSPGLDDEFQQKAKGCKRREMEDQLETFYEKLVNLVVAKLENPEDTIYAGSKSSKRK
jgi:PHD-finger